MQKLIIPSIVFLLTVAGGVVFLNRDSGPSYVPNYSTQPREITLAVSGMT